MLDELNKHFNEDIEVQGFVDKVRDLSDIQFLIIRNGKNKLQITIEKNDKNKELNEQVSKLTTDSTVLVKGKLLESPSVKMGGMELIPTEIVETSHAKEDKPFDYKDRSNALRETRLDYRFLDLRRADNQLMFEVQTYMEAKMMEYWVNNHYYFLHTPKISAGSAEGGASVFKIDYFGTPAYLSQSPQLYKQMAMASGFNKFCEISQVYRAEESHTSYHQTEIEMVDVEFSWIHNVFEVMDEEERLLKYVFGAVKEKYATELKTNYKSEIADLSIEWPRISFKEAKEILKNEYHYEAPAKLDFDRHEEELMGKYAKSKFKTDFVFIYNYPWDTRAFYTMKDEGIYSKSYDLLYKGLEITSGAQRENRYDELMQNIKEKGIDPKTLKFYTEAFEYGMPPHGGFGMGMARVMMLLFNIDNIREATFIYRGPTRIYP
jgi:nondiscriminating aspartyl-tRNA synthetase